MGEEACRRARRFASDRVENDADRPSVRASADATSRSALRRENVV
ncbi:hypothetical protein [Azospirillum endophyticum]